MKSLLIASALLTLSSVTYAQVGARIGLSIPNGIELGADVMPNPNLRVGANYGYLRYADSANLQASAGSKNVYFFGTLNTVNVNGRGREAIAEALTEMMEKKKQEPQNAEYKRVIDGYHVESEQFKMRDLGVGGGIGLKFGIFFIEGGIRTTMITTLVDEKVDNFIDSLKDYVDKNPRVTFIEKDLAKQEIEYMRADVKSQIKDGFAQAPGNLKLLPEVRIGVRIPIGRKN